MKLIAIALLLAGSVAAQPATQHSITVSYNTGSVGICPTGTTGQPKACYASVDVLPGNATLTGALALPPLVAVPFPSAGQVSVALQFTLPGGFYGAVAVAVVAYDANGVLVTSDPQQCIRIYPPGAPVITDSN